MTQQTGAQPQIEVSSDPQALAHAAAERFAMLARQAVEDHGFFAVALSGGSTPRALYQTLATEEFRERVPWDQLQVFFSDERFVPPDSDESNYRMANEALLARVPIPERFVHPVPTVDISPEQSAMNYEEGIRRVFHAGLDDLPRFDLIQLGLGPDGHTASLFPDTEALNVTDRLVVPNYVPKFESWRITFTYPLIAAAREVMFLAQGADKAERVSQVLGGDVSLPAARVRPANGTLVWMLDRAAAGKAAE